MGTWFEEWRRYRELLSQLVGRGLKLRYRYSVLGYVWSVLNPLLHMLVMLAIFSGIYGRDASYRVDLLTGITLFGFVTESSSQGLSSIMGNAGLFKKIYVPRYIFTVAGVTSAFIHMLFSLVALLAVMVWTGTVFTWRFALNVVPFAELYIYCMGLALFLAPLGVFFRDLPHLWGTVCLIWRYLSPIFYTFDTVPRWLQTLIEVGNPMYSYITLFRMFTLNTGLEAAASLTVRGGLWAAVMLAVGITTFAINQRKMLLYMS
jgi:lipopolysaccharide transport system permease protein